MAASEELHIIFPEKSFYTQCGRLIRKPFSLISFHSIKYKLDLFIGNLL